MFRLIALVLTIAAATPVVAQTVSDCSGWEMSAENIPEPWESHSRTFRNGEVRVAMIDTIEPAVAPVYLLVMYPPYGEMGERNCALVGEAEHSGFADMFFDELSATRDSAGVLTLHLPVSRLSLDTGDFDLWTLSVTLDLDEGAIAVAATKP